MWDELQRSYPARWRLWRDRLALLNDARNGLAHADEHKIIRVAAGGWPITLRSVRRWRSTLEALATGMDRVVSEHLDRDFGVKAW